MSVCVFNCQGTMDSLSEEAQPNKKRKIDSNEFRAPLNATPISQSQPLMPLPNAPCNQFWKAGDYEVPTYSSSCLPSEMDHARVHPKFLHTNATSHTWALGAFAELLDNSVDEIRNGATYVAVDVLESMKDGKKMLLVQDNGGGMSIGTIRNCMSLGYSGKSKIADTIGQYGNGFKTSTMRLGADVIVFTRCRGKDGEKDTRSIGMLSYTFLRSTGKDDIVVPILDYERERYGEDSWKQVMRSKVNMEAILQWSPYSSEEELVKEFEVMGEHGTRVIIYNLWELEQGKLELDFDTDTQDIQLAGVKRDVKKIEEANKYPSASHFLTYEHSMRSYASILYLNLPSDFRIILRGKPVEHHSLVDDMMLRKQVTYTPENRPRARTAITLGFVKDAVHHISIQGFSVYHNNRLIKPFWKVWFVAGSGGRGISGVLEANFVEPAHNKQGFEDTPLLKRLQSVLREHQKAYWSKYKDQIGYAADNKPHADVEDNNSSPEHLPKGTSITFDASKIVSPLNVHQKAGNQQFPDIMQRREEVYSANLQIERETSKRVETQSTIIPKVEADLQENPLTTHASSQAVLLADNTKLKQCLRYMLSEKLKMEGNLKDQRQQIEELMQKVNAMQSEKSRIEEDLKGKNQQVEELTKKFKARVMEIAREANTKLQEKAQQIEKLRKEANARNEIVNQERNRRDDEEAILRMNLMEANSVIEDLQTKMPAASVIKQEPWMMYPP